jgi:hypothetical protein
MACCRKSAPAPDRLPVEPKPNDDASSSLAIVTTTPAGIDFASAGASRHGTFIDLAAATTCPSLLALSIRFNV